MLKWMHLRPLLASGGVALGLGVTVLACSTPPSAAPAPTADPYGVVRATAQAAYQSGKDLLDRGDVVRGCPLIDMAKTNDPDNRPEIQRDLERCITAITETTPAPAPTAARAASVPTVPASVPTVPAAATLPLAVTAMATPVFPTMATADKPGASPVVAASPVADMVVWTDPQGRFSIEEPRDWSRLEHPQLLFGTGVIEFRDLSGRASLSVALDTTGRAVSPELYAASMELTMQQQVPGYAAEQVQPGSTAGNPSIKRVFTYTQKDSAGRELNARAFQITVLKGQTPYIITASAPADQFAQYSATFDRIADSFRFS